MIHQSPRDADLAAALAGPPHEFAAACRAALRDLKRRDDDFDAERACREIAAALADLAGPSGRGYANRALARCEAPNCAGHRTRP